MLLMISFILVDFFILKFRVNEKGLDFKFILMNFVKIIGIKFKWIENLLI